nr:hypothetical protein Iba_chr06cCG13410 [Ipomoea batatas]
MSLPNKLSMTLVVIVLINVIAIFLFFWRPRKFYHGMNTMSIFLWTALWERGHILRLLSMSSRGGPFHDSASSHLLVLFHDFHVFGLQVFWAPCLTLRLMKMTRRALLPPPTFKRVKKPQDG